MFINKICDVLLTAGAEIIRKAIRRKTINYRLLWIGMVFIVTTLVFIVIIIAILKP